MLHELLALFFMNSWAPIAMMATQFDWKFKQATRSPDAKSALGFDHGRNAKSGRRKTWNVWRIRSLEKLW